MKAFPRYGFWLFAASAALAVAAASCARSSSRGSTERFDRIRIGMRLAEVESTMAPIPCIALWQIGGNPGRWSHLPEPPRAYDQDETWADETHFFRVYYRGGQVLLKTIESREPAWQIKA